MFTDFDFHVIRSTSRPELTVIQ